jgi:predicted glycosyltransferase
MRVVIYCQYVWGMGHLFRSLEVAGALAGHRVALVAGGPEVPVDPPAHVELVRLSPLSMDEQFTTLIPGAPGQGLAAIQEGRRRELFGLFERLRPDVFIVELFPFGRTPFGFELVPLLTAVGAGRFGRVRVACSLRDVLVEKKDPQAYEQRVAETLNRLFDLLLIHSDPRILPLEETFTRLDAIRIPKVYTGFVAPRPAPGGAGRLRAELGLADGEKLVVASAGGGRSGYPLLKETLKACGVLMRRRPLRLELFTGPFMPESEFGELRAMAPEGLHVRRFTPNLVDYLGAADLSISLAGYNTCMNLLVTGVPAIVCPYARQQEQPLRVERIAAFTPLTVLRESDLQQGRLLEAVERGLDAARRTGPSGLDLDGAAATARLLEARVGPGASA